MHPKLIRKPERLKFAYSTTPTPRKVIYGKNVTVGESCSIGKDGFGYEYDEALNKHVKIHHSGSVIIGDNVEIGSNTCIDRGTVADTVIGNGTKIDNLVHIAHNVQIGENCIIVAHAGIGGSCKIGNNVYIGFGAVIREHLTIGDNAFIGMGSVVVKDVPAGALVKGNPATQ